MAIRKFSADRIFNGYEFLPLDAVIVTTEEGRIIEILNSEDAGDEVAHYSGILSPGLINAHCHLELSHMRNEVPPGTGLVNFLIHVIRNRAKADLANIRNAISEAEAEMLKKGIVGVGDIANTTHAIETKRTSSLLWHNFIEVLNLSNKTLEERLKWNEEVLAQHKQELQAHAVLTPHSPYTVSDNTFKAVNDRTNGCVISIHNQESPAENELFKTGKGSFLRLFEAVGLAASEFAITGKTSLQSYLPFFTNGQTIMLVHNTFISEEDILFAQQHAKEKGLQIFYCLCPNANLYIEKSLPPLDILLKHRCNVVLGTDSYSSNTQLSIAMEAATLQKHFPTIPVEYLLNSATSNAASLFRWEQLGVLERNKQPGLVRWETVGATSMLTGAVERII